MGCASCTSDASCKSCGGPPVALAERPVEISLDPNVMVAQMAHRMTQFIDEFRGLSLNAILYSGLVAFDANGVAEVRIHVPCASVAVWNHTATNVTLAAASNAGAAPAQGIGVTKINAGRWACVPLTGALLTLYGAAGTAVTVAVYAKPQPPGGGDA